MQITTDDWKLYQQGKDYKQKINLFNIVDKNERFYADDQWNGVKSNGLPTPVLNVIKRVINYKVSQIMSSGIKVQYGVEGLEEDSPDYQELMMASDIFSKQATNLWEKSIQDSSNEETLLDAAVSGDGVRYVYWNDMYKTLTDAMGDICHENIDNVNVFPGNPNLNKINGEQGPAQPYMLVAYRMLISDIKKVAENNGVKQSDIDAISGDEDYTYQSGDRSKIELDDNSKAICLLKMWPENGTIWFRKSVKNVIIQPEKDSGLKLYPIAYFNWEKRKNSFHGTADCTGMIPNQIFINKLAAMLMLGLMHVAFPTRVIDITRVSSWSNEIGQVIKVNGSDGNIKGVADYLQAGQISNQAFDFLQTFISLTKEMMGANEVALGEVNPENTSAFIAVSQAVSVPLESVQRRFYQFIEDLARIWLDFFTSKYNAPRLIEVDMGDGQKQMVPFIGSKYADVPFRLKVDVGPTTKWSEVASLQTLDRLLLNKEITIAQYLERIPGSVIPKKEQLIQEAKQNMMMAQQQQMAQEQQMQQQMQMDMQREQEDKDEERNNNERDYQLEVAKMMNAGGAE